MGMETPEPGDIIYVNSSLFITHAADDFIGGQAIVIEVEERPSQGRMVPFIRVEEDPDSWYNWEHLEPQQEELEKHFGNDWAYAEPDFLPEFNTWDLSSND
jgi:hypothetical protein